MMGMIGNDEKWKEGKKERRKEGKIEEGKIR